jgi:mannosyltransferase OCH1-like enzyme
MIPKKLHYCWFGGAPLPDEAVRRIESWKQYCPDYEILRWDESNDDVFKNKYMASAYLEWILRAA